MFENLRKLCLDMFQLEPADFISALGLAWQACLKKIRVNLQLLTDYDMLLMTESVIRGMCQ